MCRHSEGKTHFQGVFAETNHSIKTFQVVSDFCKLYAMFCKILPSLPSFMKTKELFRFTHENWYKSAKVVGLNQE